MAPNSFARKLGIGVRVGSQILREHARSAAAGTAPVTTPAAGTAASSAAAGQRQAPAAAKSRDLGEKTRRAGKASRRFGEAVWGPFAQVSRVLWLEVTGLFFGIFALFFAQNVYRLRGQIASGQEHGKLLIYGVLTLLFAYFTFTSFLRARRRSKNAGRA